MTIVDALEIVSLSISLFVETFDPAALIWVPGFIHFDENTGESEFVMVVIMSAFSTHSLDVLTDIALTLLMFLLIKAQKFFRLLTFLL